MAGRGGQSSKSNAIGYLFDRPIEPVFLPRGDSNALFDLPQEYIVDKYRPNTQGIFNRIKDEVSERINIRAITIPDISLSMQLGKREPFSLFIPEHRKQAARLIDVLMGMRNIDDFVSCAAYCRDRINPYMFIYALSVAVLHRSDTKNIPIPSLCETFPEKFMDGAIFRQAREESNVLDEGDRMPLEIPRDYTASDIEPEHKVAYFREDLGLNLHHWHWHLVYPFEADTRLVNKDRRGELFYYLHQQMMARYNFERLCNDLPRTVRLTSFRDPIPEGYFPKLDSLVASRVWPPRHANARLRDVYRETDNLRIDLNELERWRDRLMDAISEGVVIDESGQRIQLDEVTGIDMLGNMIESSILSVNRNFYGEFHNFGHIVLGLCHDPDARHLETFGVIGDPATAMRDPVFYKWHAYIDFMFQSHKNTLPPYTTAQLDNPGVRIAGFEIQSSGRGKNELSTFWKQDDVNLSRGMDFTPRGNVYARFTHLDHNGFTYRIMVENNPPQQRVGTVRIFLAPKFDERGLPWLFRDQRTMFIELDKFTVTLKNKMNTIERRSKESSVTIPFEMTFRNLEQGRPGTTGTAEDTFNFCGCGWPQHMLVPKGAPEGFPCDIFVMISNFENDKVDDPGTTRSTCVEAASYCGLRDKKYPDRRAMGFPFDRPPRDGVSTLRQFLTPNMFLTDVKIFFTNRVDAPRSRSDGSKG